MMKLRTLLSVLVFVVFAAFFPTKTRAGHVTLVKDAWPDGWGTQPMALTVVNGVLYFTVWNPEFGRELWRSDGTPAGTTMVKDINPGPNGSDPWHLTASGGKLFFTASDSSPDIELWVSDGTEAGTVKLDINPSGYSNPDWLTDVNGTLYCAATHSVSGRELWKSDGTIGGTVVVTDLPIPPFEDTNPTELTAVGNLLYFSGSFFQFTGSPPVACVTDGTQSGTGALGGPSPREFTAVGSLVFFVSNSELWSWNGASAAMVKKVNPSAASDARDLAAFGNILLFSVDDGIHGNELWRSDGSAAGTYMVKDINTGPGGYPPGYAYPRSFITFAGRSFFSAHETSTGRELWATDGTTTGTVLVSDIVPGPAGYFDLYGAEGRGAVFQGELYFGYNGDIHGYELWKTDGSPSGTELAADIRPNEPSGNPAYLVAMRGALYFVAYNDEIGDALWRYDSDATAVSDRTPGRDVLLQNTPNPFNPETRIAFELGQSKHVNLSIFDVQGKRVRTLIDRNLPSGHHEEVWDGRGGDGQFQSSGVYFLQLRTPDRTLSRKMVLLK